MEKYSVIYADPPWSYQVWSSKGARRSASAHYNCMTTGQIRAFPAARFAADDCALFLWAIDPLLPEALSVITAWGFTYKTVAFHWAKLNARANLSAFSARDFSVGMGYWTRANAELCLLGTRGRPRRLSRGVRRLCVSPRREHSRKPSEIHARIEALVPGPYLELFAREKRPGWTQYGDQLGHLGERIV